MQVVINQDCLEAAKYGALGLLAKGLLQGFYCGFRRWQLGYRPGEDKMFWKMGFGSILGFMKAQENSSLAGAGKELKEENIAEFKRYERVQGNDNENIPIGLAIMVLSLLSNPNPDLFIKGVQLFVGGRCTYSVAYLAGLQPWRSIFWTIGLIGTGLMAYSMF